MRLLVVLAIALCGCGPGKTKFVPEYADAYCAFLFECGDPAQLTFDGMLELEDCLSVVGPEVDQQLATCKYHKGKAHDCLKALEVAPCPDEGEDFESAIPPVCDEVWTECPPAADDDPGDTDV
jgi:hypothetical protein